MALDVSRAQILWAKRHTNKLRSGHLRGNRFTIRIRDVVPDAAKRADAITAQLLARGVPNGYGRQRFGNRGNNHEMGLLLLRNDRAGLREHGVHHISRKMRRFFVSSVQSSLFNAVLAERIRSGTMDDVILGDVAKKTETGGIFTVEDVDAESPRVKAWEISATGPIFGYKMLAAKDDAGALESKVLADVAIPLETFRPFKAKGSRRPLRYCPDGLSWRMETDDMLNVSFFAPKGAYATMLLRELMKVVET
jgi:tRNA pseudouridine13 synthase